MDISEKINKIVQKNISGNYVSLEHGITIEIVDTPVEIPGKGIELYAKAFKGGKSIGFGSDGSVEIERFRFFNPPVLVDDPNGTIIRIVKKGQIGNLIDTERKLREDPAEAIKQALAHTVKVSGKTDANVIPGKRGNTTDTFYPDAGKPGTTSCDGELSYYLYAPPYSTGHDATTATHVDILGTGTLRVENYWTPDNKFYIGRSLANFDTSSLPDADTITAATLSIYAGSINDGSSHVDAFSIVLNTISSNTNYVAADYGSFGTVKQATDIQFNSISTGVYTDFTFNATGISNISKTGVSHFGFRTANDIANTTPVAATVGQCDFSAADTAGTTQDPKLVVVHSTPVNANFLTFM